MPNRDSSASLNTWLGREGSRPASVQGEELLGAEKVPQMALLGRLPVCSRQSDLFGGFLYCLHVRALFTGSRQGWVHEEMLLNAKQSCQVSVEGVLCVEVKLSAKREKCMSARVALKRGGARALKARRAVCRWAGS